ncbi:MAG: hypothetical protein IKO72_03405 [Kiritimatiellae bacterium]|nr:hypothetical protein [Kiritimatiellia bacterium]
MRKLVINKDYLTLHEETYSAFIEEILGLLSKGESVYKIGGTKGSRKKTNKVWLRALTKGEQKFYGRVLKLYRKGNFLTMELGGLVELCKEFDKLYTSFPDKKLTIIKNNLKEIFNYEKFGEGMKLKKETINKVQCYTWISCAETWSAWHFIKQLNARMCCYCNAETIFSLLLNQPCPGVEEKGSNRKAKKEDYKRSALDHYIGHSKYPALGLSLYNLVPACTRCNTNIRGAKVLKYQNNIRPYEESFDDFFRFKYFMKGGVEFQDLTEDDIGLIVSQLDKDGRLINVEERGMNTAQFFHLEEVYNQLHRHEAVDTIRRYTLIPEARRKELEQHYPNIGRVVLERMLWGVDCDRNSINQYRLGKLTLDLLEQLGATSQDELDRIWQKW